MSAKTDPQIEELLEQLWLCEERGASGAEALASAHYDFDAEPIWKEAERQRLISLRDGWPALTPAGRRRAAGVIRRHRLAERLLADVIRLDDEAMEAGACELEHSHILSDAATDRVCTFLGHPPTCPHDKPIPRGTCCETLTRVAPPLVTRLSEAEVGGEYRVVFLASRSHKRMDRLCALGILPGARLRFHQRLPAFVVRVGETDVALDPQVTEDIYVLPC